MTHKHLLNKALAYSLLCIFLLIPITLTVAVMQRATLPSIPPLLAALLTFGAGLWVVSNAAPSKPQALVVLINLAWTIVSFADFLASSASTDTEALLWHRLGYLGIVLLPPLILHLSAAFASAASRAVWSAYAASAIFFVPLFTPSLLLEERSYFWGYSPQHGVFHPMLMIYWIVTALEALRILYRAARPSNTDRSGRVFWLCTVGFLAAIDFVPNYGFEMYPFGRLFAVISAVGLAYVLSRQSGRRVSLMPKKRRLFPYVQALSLLLLFYLVILGVIRLFTGALAYELAGILLATSTIFAGLLASIQQHMEAMVGKAFFKEKEAYNTLTEFSKAMASILDLPTLTQTILMALEKVLNLQTVSLFLLNNEKNVYLLVGSRGRALDRLKALQLSAADDIPHYLHCSQTILVRKEVAHHARHQKAESICEWLDSMESEVCLPLINKDRLIGFINLGPRHNNQEYSEHEFHLLRTLAQNAAVALDNAVLYTDLKRSQMLVRRTDRLRSLETIAGGFAHEIRNPLTSIKTFVQLAPGRREDEQFICQFSQVVIEDVYRIERLIHEILDYARYREPQFLPEDLNSVISSCLYFIEVKASSKGIVIDKQLAPDLPLVQMDRQQIKQVLLNLFLNALDAMADRGGRLTVRTHRVQKADGVWVQVEVTDSGMGIAPANLQHIFDPFYTTKHESGEHEGTGLGLTIVHQIIQEHRGYIEVESAVGAGTTFFVNLRMDPLHMAFSPEKEHEKTGLAN